MDIRPRFDSLIRWFLLISGLFVTRATAQEAPDLAEIEQAATKAAVERVAASVVRIETVGGQETVEGVLVGTGPTTGLIVDRDGYIASSAFNFIQRPASILVTLPSGERVAAEIVARDHSRMVVLLKVTTDEPLPVPQPVPVEEVQIGQWAVALGRTLSDAGPNLSVGIVSAKGRIWGKALQTDCKVSPVNYGGPLVDLRGRVMGLLVPMSPQDTSEVAGAEWYDSGIGFAVPLEDLFAVLDRLKAGENLHRGLLGVTMKSGNEMIAPARIATAPAGTPAALAGLKKGDTIVALNGVPIATQTQLKMALGPLYADQVAMVTAERGTDRLEVPVTLAATVEPFSLPFLGVLPQRFEAEQPATTIVRFVFPDSPAARVGLQVGDQLQTFNGEVLATPSAWRSAVATADLAVPVNIELIRNGAKLPLEITLAETAEVVPDRLPPAFASPNAVPDVLPAAPAATIRTLNDDEDDVNDEDDARSSTAELEVVPVRIPEESNECLAFVPAEYRATVPHGLVVWLGPPGPIDPTRLNSDWRELAANRELIVLAPQSDDPAQWQRTEMGFIRKTVDYMRRTYNIDPDRIVIHGFQAGASLALQFGFTHREIVRGVAAVDGAIPISVPLRGNDPVERLYLFLAWSPQSPLADRIESNVTRLRKFRFPVTTLALQSKEYLDAVELQELVSWVDTLDRF